MIFQKKISETLKYTFLETGPTSYWSTNLCLTLDVENDGMDTVSVANEVVVDHVIRLHTGEFPDAQLSGLAQIALKF